MESLIGEFPKIGKFPTLHSPDKSGKNSLALRPNSEIFQGEPLRGEFVENVCSNEERGEEVPFSLGTPNFKRSLGANTINGGKRVSFPMLLICDRYYTRQNHSMEIYSDKVCTVD